VHVQTPRRPEPRWAIVVDVALLALSLLVLVYGCLRLRELQSDDAYITFRYARNLYEGFGPVFNHGERVEGYSNPLWVAAIAGGFALNLEPIGVARRISLACAVLLVAALYRSLLAFSAPGWSAALTTFLISSCLLVQMACMAGLETVAHAFLFFAGLALLAVPELTPRKAAASSALLVLAALTRPEGIAYWGVGLAVVAVSCRPALLHYAAPGLLWAAHLAWRWSYYGDLLPNTWYAKQSTPALWGVGLFELRAFLSRPEVLVLVAMAAAGAATAWRTPRWRRGVALLAGTTLFHVLYVVSVGGDGLRMLRFHVPLLPSLALLAGLLFCAPIARPRARALALLGVVAIAGSTAFSLYRAVYDPIPVRVEWREHLALLGRRLAETRDPDTLIAVAAAGVLPYTSRLPTLDLLGLSDPVIARGEPTDQSDRAAPGHMKWDIDYVLSREPDLVINDLFVPDKDVKNALAQPLALARGPMWEELYGKFLWDERYTYHPIDLGNGWSAFVFERKPLAAK
jgi:hypothetical protein